MNTVLIVIHLMVVLALIGVVLLQRSEGGALGIGGGSGAFMSGRGAGNVLTRSTAILAAAFFATSIALTLIARFEGRPGDILDRLPAGAATTAPAAPPSGEPQPAAGVPATAQDLLNSLGGSGPQTPPAGGDVSAPSGSAPSGSAPAGSAPAGSSAPQPSAGPATDTTQTGSPPPDSNTAPQEPALTGGASNSDAPRRSEPIPAPAPDVPAESTPPAASTGAPTNTAPTPAPATPTSP